MKTKTKEKSKTRNVVEYVVLVLLLVLALGFMSSLFQYVSSDTSKRPSASTTPGNNSNNSTNTDNVVTPEPTPEPAEFGGVTLFEDDYSEDYGVFTSGTLSYNGNTYVVEHTDTNVQGSITDGVLRYEYVGEASEGDRILTSLQISANEQILASAYDYITVDFDITINDMANRLIAYNQYREQDSTVSANNGSSSRLYIYGENGNVNLAFDTADCNDITDKFSFDSNTIHITMVYKHEADMSASKLRLYADGNFIFEQTSFLTSSAYWLECFRFQVLAADNLSSEGSYEIDNFSMNGFEAGYEGAIETLFEDSTIKLQNCTDSVLFESN